MAENEHTHTDGNLLDLRDTASAVSAELHALTFLRIEDMDNDRATFGLCELLRGLADRLDAAVSARSGAEAA
jgi:hypothetical protein